MMKLEKAPPEQIKAGYKRLLMHDITQNKLDILYGLYNDALKDYELDKDAAIKFTADKNNAPQLAAMTMVASAMLNLDEVLTKE